MPDAPTAVRRARHRRHAWEPLTMTWPEVADAVFRRPESWLRDHMPADFPRPDPAYGLFAVEAVEAWVRRHWQVVTGATGPQDVEAILMERARAQHRRAVSGPEAA